TTTPQAPPVMPAPPDAERPIRAHSARRVTSRSNKDGTARPRYAASISSVSSSNIEQDRRTTRGITGRSAETSTSVVSRSIVTGPPASAAARSTGSRSSIRPVTAARPRSTAFHWAGVIRRARPRGDQLACRITALAVQPGQEVLPGQLRRRDPGQQLPGPEAAVPPLDGADRRIQRPDHAQPAAQLGDRGQARVRRQRRIRRADPRLLTPHAASTYPAHQIGVLSAGLIITWQRSSSQARAAPIGIYRAVSPAYSRNRV